jgi:hypothetical protein
MKKSVLFAMLIVIATVPGLRADVIRMKDGKILIGKILSIGSRGVEIKALGDIAWYSPDEIVQTEADLKSLKDQYVEITLKDNSVMRGKIKDYDADIGFSMEIQFGVITVPLENIRRIEDPEQRRKSVLNTAQIVAEGGYYFMIGDLAASYSGNPQASLSAEFSLDFLLPGLYAGATAAYDAVTCTVASGCDYLLFDLDAMVMYRFIFLRAEESFLKRFVPFVGVGAGLALPIMTYAGTATAEADLSIVGLFGLDFYLSDGFLLRVNGKWTSIAQTSVWYNFLAVNAGLGISF